VSGICPLIAQITQIDFFAVSALSAGDNQIKAPYPWQEQALTKNSYCACL
jgi:hypothetical protein